MRRRGRFVHEAAVRSTPGGPGLVAPRSEFLFASEEGSRGAEGRLRGSASDSGALAKRASALLRLALQKPCQALGAPAKNLNADIAWLVEKGLLLGVQQALDSLRVIGNNAVHPGQLDLSDDRDTATALFALLNYIVEQMITRPKELESIYGKSACRRARRDSEA